MEQERGIHIEHEVDEEDDVLRVHFIIEVSFELDAEGIMLETTKAKIVGGSKYGEVPVRAMASIQDIAEQVEERFSLGLIPDIRAIAANAADQDSSPIAKIA